MSFGRLWMPFLAGLLLPLAAVAQEEKPPSPPQEEKPAQEKPEMHDVPEAEPDREVGFEPGLRLGGWGLRGFDATIAQGRRQIDSTLLLDAGLDLTLDYHGWTAALSADYGAGNDIRLMAASLRAGYCWKVGQEGSPLTMRASVGPLLGSLFVDMRDFGDFKSSVGVEARADLVTQIDETTEVGFWIAYRQISFKFEGPQLSGDTRAGGPGFAVGVGLLLRY